MRRKRAFMLPCLSVSTPVRLAVRKVRRHGKSVAFTLRHYQSASQKGLEVLLKSFLTFYNFFLVIYFINSDFATIESFFIVHSFKTHIVPYYGTLQPHMKRVDKWDVFPDICFSGYYIMSYDKLYALWQMYVKTFNGQ